VFIPDILFFRGIRPHPKKLTIPVQTAAKLGRLHLLFYRGNDLQMYNGNILLMDNKHRKLFVSKQSKGCEFVPKMHQNTFRETYFLGEGGKEGRKKGTEKEGNGIPPPKSR